MIESLEQEVIKWAEEKGIFDNSTPSRQMGKMKEEVGELEEEVLFNLGDIKGELGDVLVTAIIQAQFHGLSLAGCLQQAHDKITKRTGKMIDGQFVKDS